MQCIICEDEVPEEVWNKFGSAENDEKAIFFIDEWLCVWGKDLEDPDITFICPKHIKELQNIVNKKYALLADNAV